MKKILIFVIPVLLIFSSCVTQKRCNQKFPPQSVIVHDSVYDSVYVKEFVRDTIIEVRYGKDTVVLNNTPVTVVNGLINSNPIKAFGELSEATSQVVNGKLLLKLEEHAESLKITLKGVIKSRDTYRKLYSKYYSKSQSTQVIKENTKFAKVTLWFFWVVIGVFGLFLFAKLKFKIV